MRQVYFLPFIIILYFRGFVVAQFNPIVDLNYQNKPLFEVLSDLERQHMLRFSYAQDRLELYRKINVYIKKKTLEQALKYLFEQNNISYSEIGGQWVLKNGPVKNLQPVLAASIKNYPAVSEVNTIKSPVLQPKIEADKPLVLSNNRLETVNSIGIQLPDNKNYATEQTILQKFRSDVNTVFDFWKERKSNGEVRVFQFSTFGNKKKFSNKTNNLSFSLAWGVHGSSEGIQIAGLGSVVRRDVIGTQLSGVFSGAGGKLLGFQASGLINSVKEELMGVQISGVFNHANKVFGGQISPGINLANENLNGIQIAGLGNIAKKSENSAQIAGIFNLTEEINVQISGLYNKANKVKGFQFATGINETEFLHGAQIGLVNRAKSVKGLQIGFINFADTLKGVSIGLLNIVKAGGYNKLEASFSESMHVLFGLKIGSSSMYQIYKGGFNLKGKAWGLGWGLGSAFELDRRWTLNSEIFALHVNESGQWNRSLNLLNQLKVGFEYKLDNGFGIFLGPTYNVMLSRYKDPETGIVGSSIPMYNFYDHTGTKGTNIMMWIGCQTGMRMRLW